MAKKRAPGAGRKPRGEFKGKSATLTTRITSETRAALDRAAQKVAVHCRKKSNIVLISRSGEIATITTIVIFARWRKLSRFLLNGSRGRLKNAG